jgi:hypothetical protein
MSSLPGPSYSLTEYYLTDTILSWQAPDRTPEAEKGSMHTFTHFLESEIGTRCLAIFVSVLALVDMMLHIGTGVFKVTYYAVSDASWNKAEMGQHFAQAGKFALLSLIGSIAFTVWPSLCRSWRYAPQGPASEKQIEMELSQKPDANEESKLKIETTPGAPKGDSTVSGLVPPLLKKAALDPEYRGKEAELQQMWDQGSLEFKHWFIQVFGRNNNAHELAVRKSLADHIYKPLSGTLDWKANNERLHSFYCAVKTIAEVKAMLVNQSVDTVIERNFHGAFVTTEPQQGFGRYILVFNSNIELLSEVRHGFFNKYRNNAVTTEVANELEQTGYVAGFSRPIPITEVTLDHIIVDGPIEKAEELSKELQTIEIQWIKDIRMELYHVQYGLRDTARRAEGILKSWPEKDPLQEEILNVLKLGVAEAETKPEEKPTPSRERTGSITEEHLKKIQKEKDSLKTPPIDHSRRRSSVSPSIAAKVVKFASPLANGDDTVHDGDGSLSPAGDGSTPNDDGQSADDQNTAS